MTAPRFAVTAIERREWPFTLRLPFRFGVITVTQGRQAVLPGPSGTYSKGSTPHQPA